MSIHFCNISHHLFFELASLSFIIIYSKFRKARHLKLQCLHPCCCCLKLNHGFCHILLHWKCFSNFHCCQTRGLSINKKQNRIQLVSGPLEWYEFQRNVRFNWFTLLPPILHGCPHVNFLLVTGQFVHFWSFFGQPMVVLCRSNHE